ncbi:2536_t:CDS:1, partial [Racocetra persica]
MNILDISQLYWSTYLSSLVYSGTWGYSATLLNDSILYIGGKFSTFGGGGGQTNSNHE